MSAFAPKGPICVPEIWMPKQDIDMTRWAVIACDQYTSQPEYWSVLKTYVNDAPSTLHMVLPEVYLDVMNDQMIDIINQHMRTYLKEGLLRSIGPSMILVDRTTQYMQQRLGLILCIDLEAYSFEVGAKPLIRTTEKTIVDRIPPRLKVRQNAPFELSHIMLLMDDPDQRIIENLYERKDEFKPIYDFTLNMDGGHIRGYQITDVDPIIQAMMSLLDGQEDPMLFIAGDGNHSLATAKVHWEQLKTTLTEAEQTDHPARFAMVEVVNLYDHGLDFEGIHRILFDVDASFIDELQAAIDPEYETNVYLSEGRQSTLFIPRNPAVAYEQIQSFIDQYLKKQPQATIDYIHGEGEVVDICNKHAHAIGIIMPKLEKKELFPYIKCGKVLPRKSFSMGHANDKRYYLEAHMIIQK